LSIQNKKQKSFKKLPELNHTPKPIAKIEMSSDSEDDSSDEKNFDSKVGIKMELKCEPSTSKDH
jgi:hypothetical protein